MGLARLDLPDPLSEPVDGSAVNADDLLSQLAGDEIDRLLSEAQVDHPEDQAAAPDPPPAVTEEALAQELDDLHAALRQTDAPSAGDDLQPAGPISQTNLSTELDQLLDAINQPEPSPAPPPATQETAPPAEESLPVATAAPSEEQAATAALLESLEPTAPAAPLPPLSPLPIWLRPLEWLNAPLAGLGDSARSTLGKAALITLFNAIVVLLYVLLFRKH